MVAVPVVVGVKTPVLLTEPMLDGLRDQVTALLKLPVPLTVAVQADVCVVRMEAGEQATETDVIVGLEVEVEPEPPLPELPPQPDVNRAVRKRNAKGILPGICILTTFLEPKSVCAKYSAKANPIMDAWQGTSVRQPASESGTCAAPRAGGRSTLPSNRASMRSTSRTWSAAHASRDCEHSARSPALWGLRSQSY